MENQDDVDTNPMLIRRDTDIASESIEIGPNERVEIVLCPERAVRNPTLSMSSSCRDSQVLVEQVIHGRVPIFREDREVEKFRRGQLTNLTVTASEPIKIVIVNASDKKTIVSASLVESGTPTPQLLPTERLKIGAAGTAYRLKNLQPEDLHSSSLGPKNPHQTGGPQPADKNKKIFDPKE